METLTSIALIIAAFAIGLILTIRGARGVRKAWKQTASAAERDNER